MFGEYNELYEKVKNNIPYSCGLIVYSEKYNNYNPKEHGDITFIITETSEDVELWRLNDMLENLKRVLYSNGISSVYVSFGGFNQVTLRCYKN